MGTRALVMLFFCYGALFAQTTFPSLEVSGAGSAIVNGIYDHNGTQNSKPKYEKTGNPLITIYFDGMYWIIDVDGDWFYVSFDDVATPDLVTNWSTYFGNSPSPTVNIYGPTINYSIGIFKESTDGNGTIENEIVFTYNGFEGDFLTGKAGENFLSTGKASITNLPYGFTARLIYTGVNQLTLRILGAAATHGTNNNVNNLTLQLTNAAFNGGDASTVFNAVKNNLAIQFRNTRTVCASGCDHITIQAAVTASASGDIIQLAAATYTETNIIINGKEIVILGVTADQTIIQAHVNYDAASNRVISVDGGQLILKDVTVRHGKSTINGAGGILTFSNCQLELHRCAIVANVVDYVGNDEIFGGGIGMGLASKLVVRDCLIANNIIRKSGTGNSYGGGLYAVLSGTAHPFLIENTTFSNNSNVAANATTLGGGLAIRRSSIEINNCTFTGNSAKTSGGGAFLDPEQGTNTYVLQNSIIYGNTSDVGADLYRRQGILNVSHSIIGTAAALSGAALNGTTVNVSATNPLLVALANNGGATQTHAIPANSPAVNAGNSNGTRLDQRGLGTNGIRDIGAFERDGLTVFGWTGTSSTDWATTTNWASGAAPTANDYVHITKSAWLSGNLPKISNATTALAKVLEIDPGAEVTIEPGGSFLISSDLENNGQLVLEGNALGGYAQVKFSGASKGTGIITKQQNFSGGWHNIGVPFVGDAGMLGTVGANRHPNAQNLRYWDATTGNWMNVPDNETQLIPGRGYIAFVGSNGVAESVGVMGVSNSILNTSVTPILDYNAAAPEWGTFGGGQPNGWNLVANPFLAALDFSTIIGRTANVEDAFYLWNPASGIYIPYSSASATPDRSIAPLQSFWVRATDGSSPSLGTLTYANTTVAQVPGFRKTDAISDHILLEVREATQPSNKDVLTIALSFEAVSDGFDNGWDARKMINPGATPSLYSIADGDATSINAINYGPGVGGHKMLPLGVQVAQPASDNFEMVLDETHLNNFYNIYLEDAKLGVFTNLKEKGYAFTYDASAPHRFKLHIGNTPINTQKLTQAVHAWVHGGQVTIRSNDYEGPLRWYVVDLNGRTVQTNDRVATLGIGEEQRYTLNDLASGIYILQVVSDAGVQNVKFHK